MSMEFATFAPTSPEQVPRILRRGRAHWQEQRLQRGMETTAFNPPRQPRQSPVQSAAPRSYRDEQRSAQLAAERRAHPDFGVFGRVVPYGRPLPGGRGDTLIFDSDTVWINGETVPLQLEHGHSLVGTATVHEERSGVEIEGTIFHGLSDRVNDRRQLSVGLSDMQVQTRSDGSLHVREARLREVSLVNAAMWSPHTDAVIWKRSA